MTAPADPPNGDQIPGSRPAAGRGSRAMSRAEHPPEALEVLIAEARYQRQRYDLYRAKTYGSRPTSESRLRELQRWCESAEARLAAARAARRVDPAGSSG